MRNEAEPWNPTPEDEGPPSRLPAGSVVMVNGGRLTNAIDADPENGTAVCYDRDDDGFVVRGPDDKPWLITFHGSVSVEPAQTALK